MQKTMKKTLSIILAILMIVTSVPFAFAAESDTDGTTIVITMTDSYGDGWNGNAIKVGFISEGVFTKIADATIDDGANATYETVISDGEVVAFRWTKGSFPYECSFTISVGGEIIFEKSDCSDFADNEFIYIDCNHNYTDSVCSICGLTCGVDFSHKMNGGECTTCGYVCFHNYTNHYCVDCGNAESGCYAGACGVGNSDNAIWSLDSEGTLTISGEGEYDVLYLDAPWKAYKENIKNVVIEEGITNIDDGSLFYLPNAVTLSIPSTVTSIGIRCNNDFAEIKVADGNNYYSVVDGVLFNYDKTELIMYPAKKTGETYTVPDNVTTLGKFSFAYIRNLKTINISDDVTTIKNDSFSYSSIENINFGKNVEVVEYNAFLSTGLKTMVLPEKLTEIPSSLFYGCVSLENLVIGSKITSIDNSVIQYCNKLKTVHFTGTEEQWQAITKPDNTEDEINTVAVHCGALEEKAGIDATCTEAGHTSGLYCDECNAYITGEVIPATGNHTYVDGKCECGDECKHPGQTGAECEICGSALHVCDFSGEWQYDSEKHWKNCFCGEISAETAHTYVDGVCGCGYECDHAGQTGTCIICGKVLHVCDFSGEWQYDSEKHWKNCSCGVSDTTSAHTYIDGVCECGYECYHAGQTGTCTICGSALHVCDFSGEWQYDSEKHWKECSCGEISAEAEHTYTDGKCDCGYECDHAGQTGTCTICGKVLHVCDFSGEWQYNSEKHWKECSCGEISEEVAHTYIDGVCECGYACEHESYTGGKCDICGFNCLHENVTDGKCDVCGAEVKDITITMTDSYGDGWSNNAIQVGFVSEGVFTKIADATIDYGANATYETVISDGEVVAFRWTKGDYPDECSFTISVDGEIIFEKSDCSDFADNEFIYIDCNHNYTDSVCSICGLTCGVDFSHKMNGGTECNACGFVCNHNYTNHYCKACSQFEDGYYAGACGANDVNDVIWSLDSEGTLIISGEGEYDITYCDASWKAYGENIKNVVIEEGITKVPSNSFDELPNAVTLSIPSTVASIDPFYNNGFAEIKVAGGNNYYSVIDGVLFNYDKTELIMYPAKKADETYTVPDGVTILGSHAFYLSENLKTVNISDDVTTIEAYCFNCASIENINFGKNVEVVEFNAFFGAELKTMVLPEKLTEISLCLFFGCNSLENLVIGSNVTSIDEDVIQYCNKLKTVHFTGTEEQWQAITKPDNSADKINTIEVHCGALEEKEAIDATCTEAGYTAGLYCDECNAYITGEVIPVDSDAHDWSNLDGICANGCGLECDHKYYNQERIRPVQNADGTWGKGIVKAICRTCGCVTSEKEVERDHEGYAAFEETVAELEALLNREDLVDGPKNDYTSALNNLKNAAYSLVYMDDEETMMRIKAIADSYISEVEAGLADGTMKKADWTYMTELFEEINAIIDNDYHNIIPSMNGYYLGPQGYYNGCSNIPTFTQASYNGNINYEKQLETLLEGLYDGTALKADYTYIDEVIKEIEEKFADEYLTDERKAKLEQIKSDIEKLKADPDTSVADLEGLERSVYNIFTAAESCFNGYHDGPRYELTEEAKCGKNAVESATCSFCGKVLTREVENSALTHSFTKYEVTEEAKCGVAGKKVAVCDNGCGATDEKAIEALRHSFTKYEEIEAPKCGVEGKKVATCDNGCGATDEKAIEALKHDIVIDEAVAPKCGETGLTQGEHCTKCDYKVEQEVVPALEHKDADGDYKCDNGCGHEFEKPAEPDTPDTPDEPSDDACDHLCHKDGFIGFIWKIVKFFWKLFKMNPVCECGAAHY